MNDRNLVITVRLSDIHEIDQPDPICLPAEELTTWRHFEALLQSMYRDPPPAIRVCYLDDESDWIEVSSDTELSEAIRIAQSTDEILQLQVKRKDTIQDMYIESTLDETLASVHVKSEDPHVTPLQTTYYNDRSRQEQYLVYPLPSSTSNTNNTQANITPPAVPQSWTCVYPLVYPHPNQPSSDGATAPTATAPAANNGGPNENVLVIEADGRSAYIQNRPDLSTEEKVKRLKSRLSTHKDGLDDNLKGLNTCLSFREMFNHASGYSSEDKIKFMKTVVTGEKKSDKTPEKGVKQEATKVKVSKVEQGKPGKPELLIEPLASSGGTPSQGAANLPSPTSLAVQDPFEVVCHDKPSRDLEQIQLNLQPNNILKPEKPKESSPPVESERAVYVEEAPIAAGRSAVNARPSAASVPPVPLLYTLQMMDGAQSGANAVAIEIPEGDHHGAAQKEEDVTASGGTSCTSASAETGEVIASRSCQDGAAVGDKVKVCPVNRQGSGSDQPSSQQLAGGVSGTKIASKKNKKSRDTSPLKAVVKDAEKNKNKKEASSKEEKKRVKEREAGCSHQKAVSNEKGSSDVKIEADVESGEKIVKKKKSKTSMLLHTKDFVKLMSKMQTELHTGIVKDVGKQTGKLLKRTFSRSASFESSRSLTHNPDEIFEEVVHRGIYCDSCNVTISGIRFKCGNCADFDFCEKCEASSHNHDPSHVFLKLHQPAPLAGKIGTENVPLLREIVYKKKIESVLNEVKKTKIECLEDVPILSISEVTTPGEKHSPPSTPSDSHKKADISHWVWDSTFDTDKHLYPLEGDHGSGSSSHGHTTALSPESIGSSQQRLSDSEIKRLYALLSIEAEAANRANPIGDEISHDLIVEMTKLTSVPELAESVHSISTLPTTHPAVDIDIDQIPLSPLARTEESTSSVEVIDRASFNPVETSVDAVDGHNEPRQELNQDEDLHSQASSAEMLEAEEEEEEDEDEAFEQLDIGEVDEDSNDDDDAEEEDHEKVIRPEHHSDSDTSDDFCVLDPPSRSDLVEVEQQCVKIFEAGEEIERKLLHHTTDVPSMEIVDHVRAEGEAVSLATSGITNQVEIPNHIAELEVPVVEQKIEAINVDKSESVVVNPEAEMDDGVKLDEASGGNVEGKEEEDKVEANFSEEDVLMKMSAEERCRFLEMVKSLKERAEDLEIELKNRKEAEAEKTVEKEMEVKYQMILEEKQKEAVLENEKLEQFQKKKEQEEKAKRQQRLLEKERERKHRQKKNKEMKVNGSGVACGEGAKKKSRTSGLGTKPTLMQMALNGKDGRLAKKSGKHDASSTSSSPLVQSPSAAVQVDNVLYIQSGKKDADCQTNRRGAGGADAAAQASQMIQHVASGVSKAAGVAFHTAKDVFYSLQAKQVEKKTYEGVVYTKTTPLNSKASPTDADTTITTEPKQESQEQNTTWMPPSSNWTPPSDTFVPPKSEWTPPKSDWKPPNVNWIPPKSEWTGPKSEWTGPKSEWTGPKTEWTPLKGYYQPPGREAEFEASSKTTTAVNGEDKVQDQQQKQQSASEESKNSSPDVAADDQSKREKIPSHEESSKVQSNSVTSSTTSASAVVPLPPLPPIQITDPILRREVQGMQLLIEMGFANREQNRKLLQEFDGDVEKVVQSLLQEEREEHWSWQRH